MDDDPSAARRMTPDQLLNVPTQKRWRPFIVGRVIPQSGGEVIPGFSVPVADSFAVLDR